MNKVFFALILSFISTAALAQITGGVQRGVRTGGQSVSADSLNYLSPKDYIIGGVTIAGVQHLDKDVILTISKLNKGDKINLPGEQNATVIKDLYKQGLFDDVQLNVTAIHADTIFLEIAVTERPRLSRLHITGLRKGEVEDLNKKLNDKTGKIVNENLISTTTAIIKKHFHEKGYLNTTVETKQTKDPGDANSVILDVAVNKHSKVKINSVTFEGNSKLSASTLRGFLKNTRPKKIWHIFGSKKFKQDKYDEDKQTLVEKMQERGYRDAEIISDTVTMHDDKTVDVRIKLHEGPKYYFGKVNFSGNATYNSELLTKILSIEKGQVFSEDELNKRLTGPTPNNDDVSSLYLNNGYLTLMPTRYKPAYIMILLTWTSVFTKAHSIPLTALY